ncbi:hypothetical protein Lepto7376_1029 [[Leptolyngbya] sp. PCC 7376]|uniref:hypothetical protein n=1 Tax=[Leptolyngbya] sp. PCC 7376 TaxID=111781 RepID=UPI00029F41F4|nr:hypothetical protein [[Leptolyngbya] sp. PCC 7376]AFY37400.1 hypothetical protein Lepto7376_1029 [[Leptolyngbya] sp. PCC 7376]
MFINIVILLFSVAIAALVFRFVVPKITTLKIFTQRILMIVGVLTLFLGVNLGMAVYAKSVLQLTIDLPVVTTLAEIETLDPGASVVLEAIASPDNPIRGRNNEYLAYVDGNGLWTPREILFDLDDAQIAMDNDTYKVRNWKRDNKLRYINPGHDVVILGENIKSVRITGSQKGKITHTIKGILIFSGSHQEFLNDLHRRLWGPRIMAGLNAFAIGAILLTTLITAIKTARRKPAVAETPEP